MQYALIEVLFQPMVEQARAASAACWLGVSLCASDCSISFDSNCQSAGYGAGRVSTAEWSSWAAAATAGQLGQGFARWCWNTS